VPGADAVEEGGQRGDRLGGAVGALVAAALVPGARQAVLRDEPVRRVGEDPDVAVRVDRLGQAGEVGAVGPETVQAHDHGARRVAGGQLEAGEAGAWVVAAVHGLSGDSGGRRRDRAAPGARTAHLWLLAERLSAPDPLPS